MEEYLNLGAGRYREEYPDLETTAVGVETGCTGAQCAVGQQQQASNPVSDTSKVLLFSVAAF